MPTSSSPVQVTLRHAMHHCWSTGQEIHGNVGGNYVLWLLLSGHLEVIAEGGQWHLPTGSVFLSNFTGIRHVVAPTGCEWLSVGLRVSLYGVIELMPLLRSPMKWVPQPEERETLRVCMFQLTRSWIGEAFSIVNADTYTNYLIRHYNNRSQQHVSASEVLLQEGFVRALFGLCWREFGTVSLDTATQENIPTWLPAVLRCLKEKPDIGIEELARELEISRRHLARQFQHWFGMSPRSYLNHRRLEEARQLLHNSALPIRQIATQTGFVSVPHFTRLFKTAYGIPPQHYRQQPREIHDIL